jgi:hypothetical protein
MHGTSFVCVHESRRYLASEVSRRLRAGGFATRLEGDGVLANKS